MEYNCKECEKYWEEHFFLDILDVDLKDLLGDDEKYIKLYCPKCKRTKRSW